MSSRLLTKRMNVGGTKKRKQGGAVSQADLEQAFGAHICWETLPFKFLEGPNMLGWHTTAPQIPSGGQICFGRKIELIQDMPVKFTTMHKPTIVHNPSLKKLETYALHRPQSKGDDKHEKEKHTSKELKSRCVREKKDKKDRSRLDQQPKKNH